MREHPITLSSINKRLYRIGKSANDVAAVTEAAIKIVGNVNTRNTLVNRFFTECKTTDVAEKRLPQIVEFFNEPTNLTNTNRRVTTFTEQIAPTLYNTRAALDTIKGIEDKEIYNECYNAIIDNMAIDRLISNHERICKRFDLNGYMVEHQYYEMEESVATQLCEWLDTYNMPAASKVSIGLEESAYMFQRYGIEYDSKLVVQTIAEYFMLSKIANPNTVREALTENRFISNDDAGYMEYLFTEALSNDVQGIINQCKKDANFNDGALKTAIKKLYVKSPADIVDGTPNILKWLRSLAMLSVCGLNVIAGAVLFACDKMLEMRLSRKQADRVYRAFTNEQEAVKKKIESAEGEKKENLEEYLKSINKAVDNISLYRDNLYTYDEIRKRDKVEQESAAMPPVSLEEYKEFKFDSVIDTANDASNYIQGTYGKKTKSGITYRKEKTVIKKKIDPGKAFREGFRSVVSSAVTEAVVEPNMAIFDAVLATFNVSEAKADEIFGFITGLTEDVSNRYGKGSLRLYTNTSADVCEVHLADTTPVMLTEAEMKQYGDYFNQFELTTVKEMLHLSKMIESYVSCDPENILKDLFESDLGFEEAYAIMEAYKYSGILDDDFVWEMVIDKYKHNKCEDHIQLSENAQLSNLSFEFNPDIPFDIQLEACALMRTILNEGINLSGIKLALQGMKDKVKQLGVKEKEVSKNMDVAANGFMRSVENALTNDRREAIIKGSIIPSFSKCIKTAIGGAAIAAIANPTCAVISLMGMLGTSRYLNNRERMLLLDEIEVELKVVDKEIQLAESEGDMQKYRKLLTYQKKLKKEGFKLRYNISRKMGKDYLTKQQEDDD